MITAVGITVADIILVMDGFRSGEGSFHCERLIPEGGGMAATALCAASRLGSETRLVSRVGDDAQGRFIIEGLQAFGVNTDDVKVLPGRNTTVSIVLADKNTGEKQFYSEYIKSAYIDPLETDLSHLDGADVLLVDGHWTDQALRSVREARTRGIPVVADFKRMYDGLIDVFPFVDYLVIPRFFAEEITGLAVMEDILRSLSERWRCIPVVTSGADGGSYLFEGECRQYPIFPIACVDSTGAGDAFHGAFCHFLARGVELPRALELSSAVGALNCRATGGRAALPTPGELTDFLSAHNKNPQFP